MTDNAPKIPANRPRYQHGPVTSDTSEEWYCDCLKEFPTREEAAAAAPACLGTDTFMTARIVEKAVDVDWPGDDIDTEDGDLANALICAGGRSLDEGYDDAFRDAAEPHAADLDHRLAVAWNEWIVAHELNEPADHLEDIQTHDPRAPEGGG